MKIIKKILIGLGAFFVFFIILIIFLANASSEFKDRHQKFVVNYTKDFSVKWEIGSVSSRTTNSMLSQINTPNGKHAISVFRRMGKFINATDFELDNYSAHAGGPSTGIFKFKAQFKNANTLVTITVYETEGVAKVHSFHINPINNISSSDGVKA